jgi:DNA helicase II / ATP-dependent DNA helicase PcrA
MRERVGAMIGGVVEGMPWLGTFHSIGARILRRHAELVGPQIQFHHPRHRRPAPAAQAAARGREHRREALAGARAGRPDRRLEEPRPDARRRCRRRGAASPTARAGALRAYQERLKTLNAADFGDLLLQAS